MRRVILFAATSLVFLACNSQTPLTPSSHKEIAVHAAIPVHPSLAANNGLTSMELVVSGENMDTVRTDLSLTATGAEGQVNVPSGSQRTFAVTGYMNNIAALQGSTTANLEGGSPLELTINLDYLISTIILSPPQASVTQDSSVTIHLGARNVQNLAIFGARIQFDPLLLRVTDLGRKDSLLTHEEGSITQLEFSKDNSAGYVDVVLGIFPASSAVSGTGPIAEITFKGLTNGEANLELITDPSVDSDLGLYDRTANEITSLALGNRIQITSP